MNINKFTIKSILCKINPSKCDIVRLNILKNSTPNGSTTYELILYFMGSDGYYHSFCHCQEDLNNFRDIERVANFLYGLTFNDIMRNREELFSKFTFTTYPIFSNIDDICSY